MLGQFLHKTVVLWDSSNIFGEDRPFRLHARVGGEGQILHLSGPSLDRLAESTTAPDPLAKHQERTVNFVFQFFLCQ